MICKLGSTFSVCAFVLVIIPMFNFISFYMCLKLLHMAYMTYPYELLQKLNNPCIFSACLFVHGIDGCEIKF
jgi:hypothetical protein